MNRHASSKRAGVSMLEVIACMGLVALMLIPLAGVIRASGQSIAQANGEGTLATQMRRGLRFLNQSIRDGEIIRFRQNRISLRMPSGNTAVVRVQRGRLEMREAGESIVLVEGVRRVRFIQRQQRSGERLRTGIEIQLNARDPETRRNIRVTSAVAIPTQV